MTDRATDPRQAPQVGDLAPDFALPGVQEKGAITLADYRGKSPVLVAMFRGVY